MGQAMQRLGQGGLAATLHNGLGDCENKECVGFSAPARIVSACSRDCRISEASREGNRSARHSGVPAFTGKSGKEEGYAEI